MPSQHLSRITSSNQLLKALLDNTALPTLVRRLPAPALLRLIERVGLADAGEIVALTTASQMREIFDETLWDSVRPGASATLRPDRFIEWLDVLREVGVEFMADRLEAMGDDFVLVNFSELVEVHDKEVILFVPANQLSEDFGQYLVLAKYDDEWDVTRAALAGLQEAHPDFLWRVLARCSPTQTFYSIGDGAKAAFHDAAEDRDNRREREGFVTAQGARAFLEFAASTDARELVEMSEYDLLSARYFARTAVVSVDEPSTSESSDETVVDPSDLADLEAILVEAEILTPQGPALLLSGPEGPAGASTLKRHLDALGQSHPEAFDRRLAEIVYLANILRVDADLPEEDSAHAALAVCELGSSSLDAEYLQSEPGLIKAFALGWHVLQRLPRRWSVMLVKSLGGDEKSVPASRRWMFDEVKDSLEALASQLTEKRFADVDETLHFLALAIDESACASVRLVIGELPRFPGALEGVEGDRWIATAADVRVIDHFIEGLHWGD